MIKFPITKEYNISCIDNLPYKLGSTIDENNIDLELQEVYDNNIRVYKSYRYSELILFGTVLEPVCHLWFAKDHLLSICYELENKYFEMFKEGINSELPDGHELKEDPSQDGNPLTVYIDNIEIFMQKLNEKFFLFKVSYYPR